MAAEQGEAFAFGRNWSCFLRVLDEGRVQEAEKSLRSMLETDDPRGRRFLDIGCGSGLFSLAARRLGAEVRSFDYDTDSVACAQELKRRSLPDDAGWIVERGSVLDREYVAALGQHDVVYSWGVLHHTGDLWRAIDNAILAVAPGGRLFVSIYNDQGLWSRIWARVKRTYNGLPEPLRVPFAIAVMLPREALFLLGALALFRPGAYVRSWTQYRRNRGMSRRHDLIDWVGGYPFQVAKPEDVFGFCRKRGFTLVRLKTCGGGLGCNEFVFERR